MRGHRLLPLAAPLLAALAAAWPPASSARDVAGIATDQAAAIFSKHATYVGRPQGLVLTYRYTPSPKEPTPRPVAGEPVFPQPAVTTYRRGALYRDVEERSGVTMQSGFTGRAFWSADENGYTAIRYEDAARSSLTANLVDADLLDAANATMRPEQKIGGVAVDVVRVEPPGGVPAEVAFDRTTGAYVQVTFDPDDKEEKTVVHIDGYTEAAPGIRVPSAYHYGESERGKWALEAKTVRAVTNDDLRGPVPTARWNFASEDATPIEIVPHLNPYTLSPPGYAVHVHASIGGREGTFLLDSGLSGIILLKGFADRLRSTPLGVTAFSGAGGGAVRARYVKLTDSIDVGKNSLRNVIVSVMPGGRAGSIDGIMGYDFLAGALVDVDIAKKTIRILDPSTMQPVVGTGAHAFPVNLADRVPEVALTVGGVQAHAIFDTGDDFRVVLSERISERLPLKNFVNFRMDLVGADGPTEVRCAMLDQMNVGPYKYQNVDTCFGSSRAFGRNGGLIGFDFLKHFNWTFDYPESRVVLTPNGQ